MTGLPTGTVTFLFTDTKRSTRLLEQLEDAYADVLVEVPATDPHGHASAAGGGPHYSNVNVPKITVKGV